MRLWHYKLIKVLPDKHLIAQWRECCAMSAMKVKGKKHVIIDRAWEYPLDDFLIYTRLVHDEMLNRNFKCGANALKTLKDNVGYDKDSLDGLFEEEEKTKNIYCCKNNENVVERRKWI